MVPETNPEVARIPSAIFDIPTDCTSHVSYKEHTTPQNVEMPPPPPHRHRHRKVVQRNKETQGQPVQPALNDPDDNIVLRRRLPERVASVFEDLALKVKDGWETKESHLTKTLETHWAIPSEHDVPKPASYIRDERRRTLPRDCVDEPTKLPPARLESTFKRRSAMGRLLKTTETKSAAVEMLKYYLEKTAHHSEETFVENDAEWEQVACEDDEWEIVEKQDEGSLAPSQTQ